MRSFLHLVALAVTFLIPVHAESGRTHHVHSSCTDRSTWAKSLELAVKIIETAIESIDGEDEPRLDIVDAAQDIFDVVLDSQEWYNLKGLQEPYKEILSWTTAEVKSSEFETLKAAAIRTMCGNSAMVEDENAPDDPSKPGTVRKRLEGEVRTPVEGEAPPGEQGYTDIKNYMAMVQPYCSEMGVKGYTSHYRYDAVPEFQPKEETDTCEPERHLQFGQNPIRTAAELCDVVFQELKNLQGERMIQNAEHLDWDNKDFSGKTLNDFRFLTALTIIHEYMHVARPPFGTDSGSQKIQRNCIRDVRGKDSYGWQNIGPMTHDEAIINADSYTWFAFITFLFSHGYALTRSELGECSDLEGAARDAEIARLTALRQAGVIQKYPDIVEF
ncbi:hypothetical protein BDV95DRAFT_595742 [Massariosphaeria phaeospora]|uniref:Lysine-specific metallo-endopeptidase domain-containing protein n=1 Tax=Massariosphaeria phaeospora TaxID=100035 RepID=A0A7C8MA54_9PLEO|nr:hypothetical protein BDV95DRAFT_595742 [Massariosphaeria phaeospora]